MLSRALFEVWLVYYKDVIIDRMMYDVYIDCSVVGGPCNKI